MEQFLREQRSLGRSDSDDRYAHDSENMCLRVDSFDRISGNETQSLGKTVVFCFMETAVFYLIIPLLPILQR